MYLRLLDTSYCFEWTDSVWILHILVEEDWEKVYTEPIARRWSKKDVLKNYVRPANL